MKLKNYSIITLFLPLLVTGCMSVIEKEDTSSAGEYIWDDYTMSTLYLDNLYQNNLPEAAWGGNINSSDEALGSSASSYIYGTAIIGTETTYSSDFWSRMRRINLMIQQIDETSNLSTDKKNLLLGQARFLRAIQYWQVVRLYGGIPIVEKPMDILLDDQDIPRSTTKACVDFIVADLDFAASVLPANWATISQDNSDFGRLTRLAALAYKGRVLLHFASPMFCERDAYTAVNGSSIPAYSISDESKTARWKAAYEANQMAYDSLTYYGYGLMSDFSAIFTTEAISNKEAVMVRLYTGVNYAHDWEKSIRPNSLGGDGKNINPTWEFAKAFPMANGKKITDSNSGYVEKFYWYDRDPRFYQTLVYNGQSWDMGSSSGRKQWCFTGTTEESGNIPKTGFYCRKAQDASLLLSELEKGKTDWIEIRMAEVMLNLAEAANMTGHRDDISAPMLRAIRERAGIEAGTESASLYGITEGLSQADMLDLILNERRIELAFENQRYWDLRRYMMYTRDLSATTLKLNGTRRMGVDNAAKNTTMKTWLNTAVGTTGKMNKDTLSLTKDNYYTYFASFYAKMIDTNPNVTSKGLMYLPDYYFMPIQTDCFSNSTKLLQTLGWATGTFDPLVE